MNNAKKAALSLAVAGLAMGAGAGAASAASDADGHATHSPGVVSGNQAQVPVHVPVNVAGNTVNAIGLLNPTSGNSATNG